MWPDMSIRKNQDGNAKCQLCKKQNPNLSEFNRMLLCASCFHDQVAAYVEGGNSKTRVAIA
jgi:hypothetical protein